jgi:hypothetical protein
MVFYRQYGAFLLALRPLRPGKICPFLPLEGAPWAKRCLGPWPEGPRRPGPYPVIQARLAFLAEVERR